jgi:hypothetical protein
LSDWAFEHSVLSRVTPEAAWAFWTDVSNWMFDPSVKSVKLDGPFAAGARGVTEPSGGAERIEWYIREAGPGHALIEIPLPGAVAAFRWTFVGVEGGTQITQRVTLSGADSDQYLDVAESKLRAGILEGMGKLAQLMQCRSG